MKKLIALSVLTMVGLSSEALAQQTPDLSCRDRTIPIQGASKEMAVKLVLTANEFLHLCKSQSGAQLTIVQPTQDIIVTPAPGSTQSFPFTVRDDKGNTASGTINVTRNVATR